MIVLREIERLLAIPGIWITVIFLNAAAFTTVAILVRKRLSTGLQWVLVVGAIWLLWLPLTTGGDLAPHRSSDLLVAVGTYLSLGCAFVCARITLQNGHGFVLLIALIEVLAIVAIALTSVFRLTQ